MGVVRRHWNSAMSRGWSDRARLNVVSCLAAVLRLRFLVVQPHDEVVEIAATSCVLQQVQQAVVALEEFGPAWRPGLRMGSSPPRR